MEEHHWPWGYIIFIIYSATTGHSIKFISRVHTRLDNFAHYYYEFINFWKLMDGNTYTEMERMQKQRSYWFNIFLEGTWNYYYFITLYIAHYAILIYQNYYFLIRKKNTYTNLLRVSTLSLWTIKVSYVLFLFKNYIFFNLNLILIGY